MHCVCVFDSEYCMEHWKEDWFFGYQCMNGSNPRMIQRCKKLPENFPVTPNMVQSSMAPRTNLNKEIKVDKRSVSVSIVFTGFNVTPGIKQLQCRTVSIMSQTLCSLCPHYHVQAGNIYLLDYAVMDGIPANTIRGKIQHIAAPLCLLYQHPDDGLIPIAIQVNHSHPWYP